MKKVMNWVYGIAIAIFVFDWLVAGLKLAQGDYDIQIECYIALGCVAVMASYILYKLFSDKCPHCGRLVQQPRAVHCPHCGKKLEVAP